VVVAGVGEVSVPELGEPAVVLGVGALSYAGQFTITAVGDRDACGDVEVFADGVRAALASLTRDAARAGVGVSL
jgi:diacylglycerol O-acyltransferase / wax synthase